jgi:hypothetical protein
VTPQTAPYTVSMRILPLYADDDSAPGQSDHE